MGGRTWTFLLAAGALLLAACSEKPNDGPTSPNFAGGRPNGTCSTSDISTLTRTEFGASSPEAGWATDLKNAYDGGVTDLATYYGYLILQSIGYKYDANTDPAAPLSTTTASKLTVALLPCMKTDNSTIPPLATFDAALGVYGAYGARGLTADDDTSVFSHDDHAWVLQPPVGKTWQDITPVTNGISDPRVQKAILIYGYRANYDASTFTNDQPVSQVVFDWNTLPTKEFLLSQGGVIVGECKSAPNFMQHNPVGQGAEVLGYVDPVCFGEGLTAKEPPATTFAQRLFRFLSPEPVQAAVALAVTAGTGTGKGSLSPYAVVAPGSVNLKFTVSPNAKTNKINSHLNPAPAVTSYTAGGTQFKQSFMLVYLQAVANNGTPGLICYNWQYTDTEGVATFPLVTITKAGGYALFAQTVGTQTAPDGTQQPVPLVGQGNTATSSSFNLKNDGSTPGVCPSFDGTYFYPDIVGDPNNKVADFPPTY